MRNLDKLLYWIKPFQVYGRESEKMGVIMKKLSYLMVILLSAALVLAGCGGAKQAAPPAAELQQAELTVSAAVSLKDALAEIQKNYQAKYPNIKLNYNLGASGALEKQIEEGAPADIFISAAAKQMDDLDKKGLIKKETRKNLVENQLVLITGKESKIQLAGFEDLTKSEVGKFAVGAPESVPAGQYAQQVLKKLNIWDQVTPKAVQAKDVRTVLTYVETGNVDAGIVYKTDAASSDKIKIVATASAETHDPIVYPIAVIANTKQNKAAEDFAAYLEGAEAQTVFAKYGFMQGK